MVVVRTVEEFQRYNEKELRSFVTYKTGIVDKDIIDDTIQEFYLKLISSRSLEKFNGNEGASFNTWVCNLLCWLLPVLKSKNFNIKYRPIGSMEDLNNDPSIKEDLWNYVHDSVYNSSMSLRLDRCFEMDIVYEDDILLEERLLSAFIRHLKRVLPEKKYRIYISYIKHRFEGMNAEQLIPTMGLARSTLSQLKGDIKKELIKWKRSLLSEEWV